MKVMKSARKRRAPFELRERKRERVVNGFSSTKNNKTGKRRRNVHMKHDRNGGRRKGAKAPNKNGNQGKSQTDLTQPRAGDMASKEKESEVSVRNFTV